MNIQPVVLWTDFMIMLLVCGAVLMSVLAFRQAQSRAQWRRVFASRLGMGSAVVLVAYIAVGLLDSLHFRQALPAVEGNSKTHYSAEVLSVLDVVMEPFRTQVEKSYSQPFAWRLFSRETRVDEAGKTVREFPRLRFGASHLEHPPLDMGGDILYRVFRAMLGAILFTLGCGVLLALVWRIARRRGILQSLADITRGATELPWRAALVTVGAISLVVCLAVELGPHYHILGTDKVGNDVFYQAVKSIRTGLVIGTLTTLVMLPFAIGLGIVAGYRRGWIDDVIQYVYTTLNSIPGVLLIAAAILMLQVYVANHPEQFETTADRADTRLLFLCVILGITSWTSLCRLLRGEALKLRETDFVQAATAFGVSHFMVIMRHILPNVMHIVLITVVLDFSGLVLAEAVLSYVGVGVDPTMTSWGNMINRARLEMAREPMVWWSLLAAFLFMFALVLAANLFSDAVRDAFDPRMKKH